MFPKKKINNYYSKLLKFKYNQYEKKNIYYAVLYKTKKLNLMWGLTLYINY